MTNHAARARELVQIALDTPLKHEEGEHAGIYAEAQVQATLALAEEQRTANLIAERDYLAALLASVPRMRPEAEVVAERVKAMHATIQDRLGLT